MLAAKSPQNLQPEIGQRLLDHVQQVEQTLATKPYIECGHPLWSSLPYLLSHFDGQARVVHLTRHPVPTAWSWLTQRAYCPPLAPHLPERVLLSPYDDGVFFISFREKWAALTAYEKALYYWTEVTAFAMRLRETAAAPWMQVQIEELFAGRRVDELLDFAGVAAAPARVEPVDRFHFLANVCDPSLIQRHEEVMEVARACAYDPLDYDEAGLYRRYVRPHVVNAPGIIVP